MIPKAFELVSPQNLGDALDLLQRRRNEVKILAGGTDLLPRLKEGECNFKLLMDISLLESELGRIVLKNEDLCIGSLVTHAQICRSEVVKKLFPLLGDACKTVGSKQIRNRGTLGGNIVNASPAGDVLPILLALEAKVRLLSSARTREMLLEDFITGPSKTFLEDNELLSEICIPIKPAIHKSCYEKLGTRNALTIALASIAVVIDSEGRKRVAYGALAPRPIRAYALEDLLHSSEEVLWEDLKNALAETIQPISDVRASAEYRKEMAANLTYMCFKELGIV